MASGNEKVDCKYPVCPTCFEQFGSPRVLPCFHTFCEKCLDTHIKKETQRDTQFRCPICKTLTVPPDSKLTVEKWARAFPLNNMIIHIMEADSETTDNFCHPCKYENENNTAEFWCIECQEQLCSSCKRSHKGAKVTRHHELVPLKNKELRDQPDTQLTIIQECPRHCGQRLELYCTQHREFCCVICFTSGHRECNDVRGVTDVAKEPNLSSAWENIEKDVIQIQDEVEKLVTYKSNKLIQIDSDKEMIVHTVDNMVNKAIGKLNNLRKNFKEEMDQRHDDAKLSLRKNDGNIQSFKATIDNYKYILRCTKRKSSMNQRFTILENFRFQIMSHYNQLKRDIQNDEGDIQYLLKENSMIVDFEKSLASLGTVEISTKTAAVFVDTLKQIDDKMKSLNSQTKISSEISAAQVEKCDLMTSPVTYVISMTRKELGDKTWFTGSTVLNGDRLVMADYINNRLVEIDDQYKVVKEYQIEGGPTDVAAGNKDNEIYIAVNGNSVYKCILDTKLTVTSRIKGPSGIWGIAVSDENIIVSTCRKVVIMTQDGVTLRTIPIQGDAYFHVRGSAYSYHYVAVSRTQRTLYLRNGHTKVVCRTLEGTEQFKFTHHLLDRPAGMCVDRDGNLYVCCLRSWNVHQISPATRTGRVLVNKLHHISVPCCVVYIPHRNELVVTSACEDTVLEVYKLG